MFPHTHTRTHIYINILYGLLCAVQIDIYGMLVGFVQTHSRTYFGYLEIYVYKLATTVAVALAVARDTIQTLKCLNKKCG